MVVHRIDHQPDHPRAPGPARVGFVVSKAVGNSVVRHHVTRRLRALMAARLSTLPDGTDVVLRAKPAAASADFDALAASVDQALTRVSR